MNELTPDPAVKVAVALLAMPPLNSTGAFPELFHVLPALVVTRPVKSFAPEAELMTRLPLDPPPTVVVPETVKANAAAVNVLPFPIVRFEMVVALPVVVVPVPEVVRLLNVVALDPAMDWVLPLKVTVSAPLV